MKIYAIDRNYPKLQKFCRYNHQKTPHNNFAKRSLSSGHITGHISQGTPHYPVKGKNDYPISNREEYRSVVALLLFFFVISAPVTQDSDSDKMRRK